MTGLRLQRSEVPYPEILDYRFFAKQFGWTAAQVEDHGTAHLHDLKIAESISAEVIAEVMTRNRQGRGGRNRPRNREQFRHALDAPREADDDDLEEAFDPGGIDLSEYLLDEESP